MPTPHLPEPEPDATIIDSAEHSTLTEIERLALEYAADGYRVFLAPNPLTGNVCLWRCAN